MRAEIDQHQFPLVIIGSELDDGTDRHGGEQLDMPSRSAMPSVSCGDRRDVVIIHHSQDANSGLDHGMPWIELDCWNDQLGFFDARVSQEEEGLMRVDRGWFCGQGSRIGESGGVMGEYR